ncbi:zinc ribbon domain-containing protein [Deinococcus taklimakanensis]|uniref:Zinc ribbon domain-containing protein n=1 Tax=Deinococcus taklimakanensis TaxID=536443 RepID=A0ABW5NZ52_9DEIO
MSAAPPWAWASTGRDAARDPGTDLRAAPHLQEVPPRTPAAAYSHCPGCGRVTPAQDSLVFCPLCGGRLQYACPVCHAPLHHPSPPGCRNCGPLP